MWDKFAYLEIASFTSFKFRSKQSFPSQILCDRKIYNVLFNLGPCYSSDSFVFLLFRFRKLTVLLQSYLNKLMRVSITDTSTAESLPFSK